MKNAGRTTRNAERRAPRATRRSVGDLVRSGDFSSYWQTRISLAGPGKILVRGYPVEELIERLTYIESIWLIVRGELPAAREAALLELAMKSGMDQQFINSAVCAARFTASAFPESPIPAIASGMLATGSVTGSPQECAEMLCAALARQRNRTKRQPVARETMASWLDRKGYVPGFGHPIHKAREPRAAVVRRLALNLGGWGDAGATFDAIGRALARVKGRELPMNLAGAIAAVMVDVGWRPLEIGALGAVAYAPALVAHVVEEIIEGVPLRIIPDALGAKYTGAGERHLPRRPRTKPGVRKSRSSANNRESRANPRSAIRNPKLSL